MFSGSMVALITPMTNDGAVDYKSLSKLIDMHVSAGTNALVVVGTTGEAATLDADEQKEIIAFTLKYVAGRIPVIAGTAANSTEQAIHKTRAAMQAGVDACLLLAPAYIKPTQEGLYQHFKAIADAVAIPQIIYNVPGRTACDILPDTVVRLAEIPNIIGIKEATGDMQRVQEILWRCGESLHIYSGDDGTGLPCMLLGGKGVISVTANVAPSLMSQMCSAALKGDAGRARSFNDKMLLLHKWLFVEANPIPSKWCLYEMGLCEKGIRLPLTILSEQYRDSLREAMKVAELI